MRRLRFPDTHPPRLAIYPAIDFHRVVTGRIDVGPGEANQAVLFLDRVDLEDHRVEPELPLEIAGNGWPLVLQPGGGLSGRRGCEQYQGCDDVSAWLVKHVTLSPPQLTAPLPHPGHNRLHR